MGAFCTSLFCADCRVEPDNDRADESDNDRADEPDNDRGGEPDNDSLP